MSSISGFFPDDITRHARIRYTEISGDISPGITELPDTDPRYCTPGVYHRPSSLNTPPHDMVQHARGI